MCPAALAADSFEVFQGFAASPRDLSSFLLCNSKSFTKQLQAPGTEKAEADSQWVDHGVGGWGPAL